MASAAAARAAIASEEDMVRVLRDRSLGSEEVTALVKAAILGDEDASSAPPGGPRVVAVPIDPNGEDPGTGRPLLQVAVKNGRLEAAEIMLRAGAHATVRYTDDFEGGTESLMSVLADITGDVLNEQGPPEGFLDGIVSLVRLAVQRGADPNEMNDFGTTPLSVTLSPRVADALIECGADVNYRFPAGDNAGSTALNEHVCNGDHEMVAFLLQRGANPNLAGDRTGAPLRNAVFRASLERPARQPAMLVPLPPHMEFDSMRARQLNILCDLVEAGATMYDRDRNSNVYEAKGEAMRELLRRAAPHDHQFVCEFVASDPDVRLWQASNHPIQLEVRAAIDALANALPDVLTDIVTDYLSIDDRPLPWMPLGKSGAEMRAYGKQLYSRGQFLEAAAAFSRAVEAEPGERVHLSNRSMAFTRAYDSKRALADARECVLRWPDWPRGHERLVAACELSYDLDSPELAAARAGLEAARARAAASESG